MCDDRNSIANPTTADITENKKYPEIKKPWAKNPQKSMPANGTATFMNLVTIRVIFAAFIQIHLL